MTLLNFVPPIFLSPRDSSCSLISPHNHVHQQLLPSLTTDTLHELLRLSVSFCCSCVSCYAPVTVLDLDFVPAHPRHRVHEPLRLRCFLPLLFFSCRRVLVLCSTLRRTQSRASFRTSRNTLLTPAPEKSRGTHRSSASGPRQSFRYLLDLSLHGVLIGVSSWVT